MIGNITIIKYIIKFKQSPDIAVNDLADKTDVNSTSVIKWDLENQYFAIQDWRLEGDIIMIHFKGVLNLSDAETKPLGYVLHK